LYPTWRIIIVCCGEHASIAHDFIFFSQLWEVELLFNLGTYPGGGEYIIVKADGEPMEVNSGDLIHDLEAYSIAIE